MTMAMSTTPTVITTLLIAVWRNWLSVNTSA